MNPSRLGELVDYLTPLSPTWLPPTIGGSTSLRAALSDAVGVWPKEWDRVEPETSPLLFPLAYAGRLTLSTATFHQLVDAASEASRADTDVALVAVPTGRSGGRPGAGHATAAVAESFQRAGFPVTSAGDVAGLDDLAPHLVARACSTRFTRRQVDLADMLVAATADALRTTWAYQPSGLGIGPNLGKMDLCQPLCRLYELADPFAVPPVDAKRPPSGSDAVWASAFTLGATHSPRPPDDRSEMERLVGTGLGPLWETLRRRQLCSEGTGDAGKQPVRLRTNAPRQGRSISVPLFGAPAVAGDTRTFIAAAAMTGPATLVVDDLTPRFCYPGYPQRAARLAYDDLARIGDVVTVFLTDLPDVDQLIHHTLDALTVAQVRAACGNRHRRRRGGLTGHDAIHLAVMAVCCAHRPANVAVRSANVAAIHAMTPIFEPETLLTFTGSDPDIDSWNVQVPARWLPRDEVTT
jgi:hypothetical protein